MESEQLWRIAAKVTYIGKFVVAERHRGIGMCSGAGSAKSTLQDRRLPVFGGTLFRGNTRSACSVPTQGCVIFDILCFMAICQSIRSGIVRRIRVCVIRRDFHQSIKANP